MYGRVNKAVILYTPLCGMWWPVIRKIDIDIKKVRLPQTHQPKALAHYHFKKERLNMFQERGILDGGDMIILRNPLTQTPSSEPNYDTCLKQL